VYVQSCANFLSIMHTIAVLSVVLGVASCAPQVFPQHAPLDAARAEFLREYNRLAHLAAAAPDIHIIMGANEELNRRLNAGQPVQTVPTVSNHIAQPVTPTFTNPAFDQFGFTANLGTGQNFGGHLAGHQAGHLAGHQAGHHVAPAAPTLRWTGPLAHTVPAGVHGLPTQVQDTPEVQAAAAAHFAAHRRAHAAAGFQG